MKSLLAFSLFLSLSLHAEEAGTAGSANVLNNPVELYKAAAAKGSDRSEAMFLFIIADFRVRIDQRLFPANESGTENPGILLGALRSNLALELEPEIVRSLRDSDALIDRLRTWIPECSSRYTPFWKSDHPLPVHERESIALRIVKDQLTYLASFARLLRMPEYWDAYLVKTARKLPAVPKNSSTAQAIAIYEEWDKAGVEADSTIARIEKATGTPVLSESRPNRSSTTQRP